MFQREGIDERENSDPGWFEHPVAESIGFGQSVIGLHVRSLHILIFDVGRDSRAAGRRTLYRDEIGAIHFPVVIRFGECCMGVAEIVVGNQGCWG